MSLTHNACRALTLAEFPKPNKYIIRAVMVVAVFVLGVLAPGTVNAEPLTLTINPTTLTGTPGGTVIFTGSIINTTGVTLNATDLFINSSGFDPSIILVTQLLGTPDFVLPNNTFSPVVNLFSVTLSPLATAGTYTFEVFLQDIENNLSNVVVVSVNVDGAAVPEPATLLLLLTGLAGAGITRYKRNTNLRR